MVDGPNLYLYCRNNPVNWVDPFGLYEVGPWGSFNDEAEKEIGKKIKEKAPELSQDLIRQSATAIRKEMTADEYKVLKDKRIPENEKLSIMRNIILRAKEKKEYQALVQQLNPYIQVIVENKISKDKKNEKSK